MVLHQPEIPQNVGNIGRTCVAVNAKLWLVRPLGFRLDDSRLKRAGLDYWPHLLWQTVDHWQQLEELLPGPFWYLSRFGQRDYRDVAFEPGAVFVFGNESQGLPPTIRDAAPERLLRIPTTEAVRSLNLSNAVAVIAYEAIRQWNWRPA